MLEDGLMKVTEGIMSEGWLVMNIRKIMGLRNRIVEKYDCDGNDFVVARNLFFCNLFR